MIGSLRSGPVRGAWVFGVIAGAQVGHLGEHIAVVLQGAGVFGPALDNELSHLAFNASIAVTAVGLVALFPRNPWVYPLLAIALVHGLEHVYIYREFLSSGVSNGPGVLAQGGVLGLIPLLREDLHNVYNGVEAVLMVLGFSHEIQATFVDEDAAEAQVGTRAGAQ